MLKRVFLHLLLLLLTSCSVVALDELTFRATQKVQEAKLYHHGTIGYSLELVEIRRGKAVFLVNGNELTRPIEEGEEFITTDGSVLEPTLIKPEQGTVKFLFTGSGDNALSLPAIGGYSTKTIPSQYNYTSGNATPSSILSPASSLLPAERESAQEQVEEEPDTVELSTENQTEERVEEHDIVIAGERETFGISWLDAFWTWLGGLFD